MDHMNSFNSLNHSFRWTRNNDTMWQSSTVTLCYHATHCVTELVYGGYSMYRGWFVQFLHSFYAFSASEKPSVKCFFCLWWKCAVLIVTKNEKETEKIFIQVKTPAGIFVWEVRQEDKIGTSCDTLPSARWKPCKGFTDCQADTSQHLIKTKSSNTRVKRRGNRET